LIRLVVVTAVTLLLLHLICLLHVYYLRSKYEARRNLIQLIFSAAIRQHSWKTIMFFNSY